MYVGMLVGKETFSLHYIGRSREADNVSVYFYFF